MTTPRVSDARAWLVIVSACIATAVAVWLVPASVHIVGWEGAAVTRVALLPPLPRLLALVTGALVVGAVAGLYAVRHHRLQQLSSIVAPATLLGLWLVPYVPLLTDRAPLLLTLAGPLRWLVAATAAFGCVVIAMAQTDSLTANVPTPGLRTVFILSLVVFVGIGIHVKRVQGLGGDEPHYLVIAHSLLVDGDLSIENNHEERHYQAFHRGLLPPHFLRRGLNGTIYSVHAPGLPALLLPFYAAGGHWGAMLCIAFLASLAATAIFMLARHLTTGSSAVMTWVAVTLTVPFALQSWLIFPEMPAALVMACVALWLWSPLPRQVRPWLWRGALVAVLPWLHTKYSLLLAGAVVCLLVRLWPRIRLGCGFLTPVAVSGALWLGSFFLIYGTPNPTAQYGPRAVEGLELTNVPRGVLGLVTDQEYGLLTYSPVYLLAAVGCWVMLRRRDTRWQTIGLLATTGAFVASVTQYYMWWGGFSVPARFLVPVLPLLAPMIAVAIDQHRGAAGRGLVGVLLALSVGSLVAVVYDPAAMLMFNDRDGTGRLVELLQGGIDLTAVLATFLQVEWMEQLPRVSTWLVAAVVSVAAVTFVGRARATPSRMFWSGAVGLIVFGVTGSVAAAMTGQLGDQGSTTRLGQQSLMWAYDGERLPPVWLDKERAPRPLTLLTPLTEDDVLRLSTIHWRRGEGPQQTGGRIAGPFALPPGRYEVDTTFDGRSEASNVWVAYRRGPNVLVRVPTDGAATARMRFTLPVGLDTVWVGSRSERVARSATAVRITPSSVAPSHRRPRLGEITHVDGIDAETGRYVVYLDRNAYPEGGSWWVAGGRTAETLVTPGGATQLRVTVVQGAEAGPVRLRVGDSDEQMELGEKESRERTFQLGRDAATVPLSVSCQEGFRPSDHDPVSTDTRWLGCYVQVWLIPPA